MTPCQRQLATHTLIMRMRPSPCGSAAPLARGLRAVGRRSLAVAPALRACARARRLGSLPHPPCPGCCARGQAAVGRSEGRGASTAGDSPLLGGLAPCQSLLSGPPAAACQPPPSGHTPTASAYGLAPPIVRPLPHSAKPQLDSPRFGPGSAHCGLSRIKLGTQFHQSWFACGIFCCDISQTWPAFDQDWVELGQS